MLTRQTELKLSEEDRSAIEAIRSKGVHQARVIALAFSAPPKGRQRWTMVELERAARQEPAM